ncbi:hypothetical protein NE237_013164 [Protea cynaroides]|uniref:Uncharacterized protein n=1 Tax=Protea cynaroides TaxID=273540 RepID=A0A9Q0H0G3_9MAGN|nr:hypothetical protein NE237_013164 [Protea cynaroides]
MCFMMNQSNMNKVCYVQFPHRFDGIDANDWYADHNSVFYDIALKCLDGIQGPLHVGTGCFLNRKALYGYDAPLEPIACQTSQLGPVTKSTGDSHSYFTSPYVIDESRSSLLAEPSNLEMESHSVFLSMEKCFGHSPLLLASNLLNDDSFTESVISDEVLREAIHVISCEYEDNTAWGREIGWIYGFQTGDILTGFKMHTRGWRSIYCMPQHAAFRGSAIVNLSDRLGQVLLWALCSIEILFSRHCPIWWSGVTVQEWWRNQQLWLIAGVSSHLFAVIQGLTKAVLGIKTSIGLIKKKSTPDNAMVLYTFKWTSLLIFPMMLILINLWGMFVGIFSAVTNDSGSWRFLFAKLLFAFWVTIHLHPFLKGLLVRKSQIPAIVIIWSVLLAALFSVLWLRLDPYTIRFRGPDVEDCGIVC